MRSTPITPFRITVFRSWSRRPFKAHVIGEGCVENDDHYFTWVERQPLTPDPKPKWTDNPDGDVLRRNEGITWAREWDGEEVEALKVAWDGLS